MGCASSKIDDLPAVQLCRERLEFLDAALHQRYAFAEAHVAYVHSLKSIGDSLHRFFDSSSGHPPVLTLPPEGKGKESGAPASDVPGPGSGSGHLSHSNSGGHIDFHSDTDSDDDDEEHHLHDDSDDVSGSSNAGGSLHHHHDSDLRESLPSGHLNPNPRTMMYEGMGVGMGPPGPGPEGFNPYFMGGPGGGYGFGYGNNSNTTTHMNFMRRHVTPSVSYQQKPVGVETVQMGDPSSSSYYADYAGNYGYGGGFFGGPAQPVYAGPPDPQRGMEGGSGWGGGMTSAAAASSSSSKQQAPPPPPPPPSTSAWDFLNPFESIESSYPPYTPSRDSREVREEEGIPDLEDEVDFEHEVVKEVHGHQKLVDDNNSNGNDEKGGGVEDEVGPSESGDLYRGRGRASSSSSPEEESTPVEYEVHMVDKKVVGDEGKSEQGGKSGGGGGSKPSFRNVFEVVREIQVQFERASASGNEIAKVLEVGKLRYHRKNHAYQVSSKMLHVITPSLPSTSKDSGASLDPDEDVQLRSVNLSATLQKLYLWEKKLFEEVKAEEKMRVLHDRKVRKLKRLDERGAESAKVDATRNVIRSLSTKIRIAIQIVDKISVKINNVRDDELWPQLKDLILGLCRMWKAMLECHHSQCQAIEGARDLDAIAFPNNPSDTQLEATLQLEHDLINWTCRFTEWVGAQKGFVRALNCWLFKCLLPEPEVTDDGIAPFSPGRAGAPPVFVICHQWNQSLERISETSEKEVVDSMRVFATMVWHFRERDKGELRQRMTANRDMERKVKNLEREDVKMQKEMQALDKKMVLSSGGSDGLSLSGNVVYQSDTSSKTSLQAGLLHIFEAMDRFTADSVQVYEELLQRSEEVVR